MPESPVPSSEFATAPLPGAEQFDAWREAISVIFDVEPLKPARAGFDARVKAYHLGELLLVNTRFDRQRFVRTERQARSDWMDHYLVQFYRDGGYVGEVGNAGIHIPPGSVSVLDLARPLDTRASAAECLTLVVPREIMAAALPGHGNLHGRILDDAAARLFRDYMASLERNLPGIKATQAQDVSDATLRLLAACLQPTGLQPHADAQDLMLLARIREHVEAQLDTPTADGLSVEEICRVAGVSRSRLYALFKHEGGVHHYILERRLLRVHRALADPRDGRPIMELAERYGFASHAHLSRQFRQRFGYSPSEVRGNRARVLRMRAKVEDAGGNSPRFDDWVRTLRA